MNSLVRQHGAQVQKEEAAIEAVKKGMGMLEKHLHSRTFLVGNSVTLADIVGACNLYWGYTKVCLYPK